MSKAQMLKEAVRQRLAAAADDTLGMFEGPIAEYEEALCRQKEENERQRKLLEAISNPQLQLRTTDIQQLLKVKDEFLTERQEWCSSLDRDPEPPHVADRQEEPDMNGSGAEA